MKAPKKSEKSLMTWKCIVYDAKEIKLPTTYFFLDVQETNFKDINDFTESEIIQFIKKDNIVKALICETLGLNQTFTKILEEQKKPFILDSNSKPGDIDLILFEYDDFENAIALEVKCIKAETLKDGEIKVNKENNISKGITQANSYLKVGFCKTYLLLILLDNGEKITGENQFFRSTNLTNTRKLFNPKVISNLDDSVGLIYLKVNQITGKSIYETGKFSIYIEKEALKLKQSERISNILLDKRNSAD